MFLTKIKPEEERRARLTPAERREDDLITRAKAQQAAQQAAQKTAQQHRTTT